MSPPPIIIIGAGVAGLTTACLLQSQFPDIPIKIIAAETPTTSSPSVDYASMWAGAHYRPIHPLSTAQAKDDHGLALRTVETMRRIARQSPEAGVAETPAIEYFEKPSRALRELKTGDEYAWSGDGFRVLGPEELPPKVVWGCMYQTYCVNVSVYCRWLMDRIIVNGGQIIQQRLSSATEAFDLAEKAGFERPQVVVNCSGRNFDQDPKTKIIRGQTILVKQQYHTTVTRQNADGSWAFLIPRPLQGGTIVGGTKEIGDWKAEPRAETRNKLLKQCIESFPDFVDNVSKFKVVQDNVGRRPWREGGYRFEVEVIGPEKVIAHGYGAGGRGYELSWGAAGKIVELVKSIVAGKQKL